MPKKIAYRIIKRLTTSIEEESHDPGFELNSRRVAVSVAFNLFKKRKVGLVRVEANGEMIFNRSKA